MKERYGSTMAQALKTVLPVREKIRHKEKRFLYLNTDRETAGKLAEEMEKGRCRARARLVRALLEESPLEYTKAARDLGITAGVISPLAEQGVIRVDRDEVYRIPAEETVSAGETRSVLSPAQEEALDKILKEWAKPSPRPVLLHGITGSGKTEVYMKLIEKVISSAGR